MPNTSGDLYIFSSIPVKGVQPSHSWQRNAETGLIDKVPFIPGVHLAVEGSTLCDRESDRDESILDPEGDEAYAVEMKYGSPVPMDICHSKHHKGSKRIPKVEFEDGATKCRRCQRMEEFLARGRSTPEHSPKKAKWFRQFHGDKRARTR